MTSSPGTALPKIDYTATPHPSGVKALSLKDEPSLIESLLPVQKLSIDVYKERMAGSGQTLTALGSYWKGRKPLVLNRACVLASLLPATDNPIADLEVFELLMGMDDVSMSKRLGLPKPEEIVRIAKIPDIQAYFIVDPPNHPLPRMAPFEVNNFPYLKNGRGTSPKLKWRGDISETAKHELAALTFEFDTYRDLVNDAKRVEEVVDTVSTHIWARVNSHLGTDAHSFPELVEQLGVMRFGHRPTVADTFSGSGQIPFAAAQLGCDVYASDLNPIACLLTWGAFHQVGVSEPVALALQEEREAIATAVANEIKSLGFEDANGWRAKTFLYCLEVTCPSSGWKVPLLPSLIVSKQRTGTNNNCAVRLIPNSSGKRYEIEVLTGLSTTELSRLDVGTFRDGNLVHSVDGVEHINSLASIRGDYVHVVEGKRIKSNKHRRWGVADFSFQPGDIFAERLYAVQWFKADGSARPLTEFRSVTQEDVERERAVESYVSANLLKWQKEGYVSDAVIETGSETERLSRERGWTHWHHLFNARQLLTLAFFRKHITSSTALAFTQILNWNARQSRWNPGSGGGGSVQDVFYNQAFNTLLNYGCRGVSSVASVFKKSVGFSSIAEQVQYKISNLPANLMEEVSDIFITDPPYGDAVAYEELSEFFIAWFRRQHPSAFSSWNWDSRRELAIKGENHDFRLGMVAAYKRMAECMPENGLQILMFTHQDGDIWADMANIVWASGLRVTAAWYLVTETDSALREGSYVKGTILLVLRKRLGTKRTNQTDLAYELQDEVADQIQRLTGMNETVAADDKRAKDGNLFEDADLQMAGYAAALKVLTKYSIIDGKDMAQEALRPRVSGQKTLVESLIDFATDTANKMLVPLGLDEFVWHELQPAERFYLKMLEQESHGLNKLDNYQNFAKAFGVRNFSAMMASENANKAALKSAMDFGRVEMNQSSELHQTPTRAVMYALMDLQASKELDLVLKGLEQNLKIGAFYSSREILVAIARFIAKKVDTMRPDEASAARVLADGIDNQRM